jgi:hypothetical protein
VTGAADMVKWTGRLILHVPLFLICNAVASLLIRAGFDVLLAAGANLRWDFLSRHFFVASLISGLLAGFLVILLVHIILSFVSGPDVLPRSPWTKPQAWIWLLFTTWLVRGIFGWVNFNATRSVLSSNSGITASRIFAAFFGPGCALSPRNFAAIAGPANCPVQLIYTNRWMAALGYSAAIFFPSEWTGGLLDSLRPAQWSKSPSGDSNGDSETLSKQVV